METLILRRKYFYSDQNVDSRDPIQLNLLYVQVSCLLFTSSITLPISDYHHWLLPFHFFGVEVRRGIKRNSQHVPTCLIAFYSKV